MKKPALFPVFGVRFASACLAVFLSSCGNINEPVPPPAVDLAIVVNFGGAPAVSEVVVEVMAPDIPDPLVINLTLANGTASGSISIPVGSDRTITVRAFNGSGIETHRGSTIVDVNEGTNPVVDLTIDPLLGDQPINILIGSVVISVTPSIDTLLIGEVVTLQAIVLNGNGDTLIAPVSWATNNPALATVDTTGLVSALATGQVQIVAVAGGVAASATIHILPGILVFPSTRGGPSEIFRIKPDGTGLVQLTTRAGCTSTCDEMPDLSPDRTRLLLTLDWNVFVGNADGSALQPLTNTTPNTLPNIWARWSPDGSQIAWESQFACCGVANREIWIMNADGSGQTRLTNNTTWEGRPSWSPDGSTLVFHSDRNGPSQIFTMATDGSNVTQLTTAGTDYHAHFSPDGAKILFTRSTAGSTDIYLMNADGSQQQALTTTGDNREAVWSPDGQWIAFLSQRDGDWDIYTMAPDGTALFNVTDDTFDNGPPSWR